MFSFKIWPLVLVIYSFIITKDQVLLSATYIPDDLTRAPKQSVGGYVGCLVSDVCLPNETCQNDELFGKCVEEDIYGSAYKLTYAERSLLKNLQLDFSRIGLDFSSAYVQCVFRSLILKFRLQDQNLDVTKICGEMPDEIVDTYDDSENLSEPTYYPEAPNKSRHETDSDEGDADYLENIFDDAGAEADRTEFPSTQDDIVPQSPELLDYDTGTSSLLSYLKDNLRKDKNGVDESPVVKASILNPKAKKMPVKRFNRDKVVKFGNAEFDRRTRNTIWLRLSKPVNYIQADEILQELSENMDIRPPIAQFQLDKTGHVLLFFVPFETGLVANDVISMMRQNPQWLEKNRVSLYGIGMPILTEPIGGSRTVSKAGVYPMTNGASPSYVEAPAKIIQDERGYGGQLTRVGFFAVVLVCSLAIFMAIVLFAHTLVRRRDQVSNYLSETLGKGSRKPSERPLMPPSSPANSTGGGSAKGGTQDTGSSMSALSGEDTNRNESLKKQQGSMSPCSTTSPPPYQEAAKHDDAQEAFRRPLVSTGGSEASTESMAGVPTHRTFQSIGGSAQLWSDEPIQMNLDVTTGHLILSYMEEHLRNRDMLDADWEEISTYESEEAVPCEAARRPENAKSNRDGCPIPYEQTRVMLSSRGNGYINASLMYDHDPRNPSYIAAETPLLGTVNAFWQMVWEQFAVVIVCLEPESALTQVIEDPFGITGQGENDTVSQARYWPPEGSMIFGKFEVRLVSEHRQSADHITRSFYLKDRDSGETRTVTQFHFLNWAGDTPSCDVKVLLDFRRKVNRSFRAKNSPVVVHCRDGSSKTGTYLLLDLVLSRISNGVKELDVAASLEHLRDQRQGIIKTKDQFELVLAAIAEEVNMMLNSASANAGSAATPGGTVSTPS